MDKSENKVPPAVTGGRANALGAQGRGLIANNCILCKHFGGAALLHIMLGDVRSELTAIAEHSGDISDRAIACLDTIDGDENCEADGDESDGNFAEDEAAAIFVVSGDGPGCALSDAGEADDGE